MADTVRPIGFHERLAESVLISLMMVRDKRGLLIAATPDEKIRALMIAMEVMAQQSNSERRMREGADA